MKILLIIPQKNEAQHISLFLDSLVEQTLLPDQVIVIDDGSTDHSPMIISEYSQRHSWLRSIRKGGEDKRASGTKVVDTFNFGLDFVNIKDYDLIGKMDADLQLPENYLSVIGKAFANNPRLGIAGGVCVINKEGQWVDEGLNRRDHVRGALKMYRQSCLEAIGGLRPVLGWDSLDEHLARFEGWEVKVIPELKVRHLRPTNTTSKWFDINFRHGRMFYEQRYGFFWGVISSFKRGFKHKPFLISGAAAFMGYIFSWFIGVPFIITREQGKFIQQYRADTLKDGGRHSFKD